MRHTCWLIILFVIFIGVCLVQSAEIEVLTKMPLENGDLIKIQWNGVDYAKLSDHIRLLCPPSLEKYFELKIITNSECQDIGKVSGMCEINIYYTRSECKFIYLQQIDGQYVTIAETNTFKFIYSMHYPHHLHIALTENENVMRVTWVSGIDEESFVLYGKSEDELSLKVYAETTTYSNIDMCEEPATTFGFISPGYIHSAIMIDLEPSTTYFYNVGCDIERSKLYSIRTINVSRINYQDSVTLVAFGDMDITSFPGARGTMMGVELLMNSSDKPNLIQHLGDISYAMGIGYKWDEFESLIEPVAAQIPYMMTIGNHEQNHVYNHQNDPSNQLNFRPFLKSYSHDSGGECGVPLYYRYPMPRTGNSLFWYSYDYGMMHMVSLSSENDFTKGSPQYNWLANDLASVSRKTTPWVVVSIHRALVYSSLSGDIDEVSEYIRLNIEPLLLKYKVNFVLSGHYHMYERACPLRQKKCVMEGDNSNSWGYVSLTVGTAGRKIDNFTYIQEYWSRFHSTDYGFGVLKFISSTTAIWQFRRNIDNKVIDHKEYYFNNI